MKEKISYVIEWIEYIAAWFKYGAECAKVIGAGVRHVVAGWPDRPVKPSPTKPEGEGVIPIDPVEPR